MLWQTAGLFNGLVPVVPLLCHTWQSPVHYFANSAGKHVSTSVSLKLCDSSYLENVLCFYITGHQSSIWKSPRVSNSGTIAERWYDFKGLLMSRKWHHLFVLRWKNAEVAGKTAHTSDFISEALEKTFNLKGNDEQGPTGTAGAGMARRLEHWTQPNRGGT